ncbi:hypothetical protein [Streptomyces sp. NPDC090022]|uniref:hypothetical protein n=1 Tax=Streptomyces sp. NPDC090022 TaxID=3365920 RepID=UPI00381045F0
MASIATRTRRILRLCAAAGMTCGLAAGLATPAHAGNPPAPTVQRVWTDGSTAYIRFRDNTDGEDGFWVVVFEKDNPNNEAGKVRRWYGGGSPGTGRMVTKSLPGIKPGVAYCGAVQTRVPRTDPAIPTRDTYDFSGWSNNVCVAGTDPANPAGSPKNASLGTVNGEFHPPVGTNRTYWVPYFNSGAEAKNVVVDVTTDGSLSIRKPPDPGIFSGFTCALGAAGADGKVRSYRCTGGTLAAGEKKELPVFAHVDKAGQGVIRATMRVAGDINPGDNSSTYPVMAQ